MAGVQQLRVRILGGLAVEDVPVLSLGSRKARAVVRRLAVADGASVAIDELVEVAWPDSRDRPSRAAEQLSVLVSRLRGVVGAPRLPRTEHGYALLPDWSDVRALREHVAAGEDVLERDAEAAAAHAKEALALLRGPLLPEEPEADWAVQERRLTDLLATRARLLAAAAALRTGSPWEALEQAERCREADPFDEAALRLQLRALAATSRTAVAVTTYLEAARVLRDELGTEPEAATQAVYLDLLREQPPPRRPAAAQDRRLAGRDAELLALDEAWAVACAGTPQLVVVAGPAGIGKSTLLDVFAQRLEDTAAVLRAVPDALGAELPLQPVLDALSTALKERDVEALLAGDYELLAPLLGRAPLPASTASAFAVVTSGAGRAVLLAALEGLLHRLGEDAPVLVVLDDAHAADETTVQLLHRCTRAGAQHRLLVVVAARPGGGPTWQGRHLAVGPLDRQAVAVLVGEERAEELWVRSGGHPLFVTELARYDGREPPASVLAAVASRCAGTDDVTETLRAAAVLGAEDDVDLLAAVRRTSREEVLGHLESAAGQALLVEDARGFSFAHQMFREAFAAGVGQTRAAALHREAAHELNARRTSDPARVAHHADLGGEPVLAAEALTTAAERASQRYEHAQALALLDRAVALEDTVERRLARARVLLVLGRLAEAEAEADEALARGAGAPGLEVAALVAYFERDTDRALELADEAARLATDPELVAGCWCLAGRVLLTTGRLDEGEERLAEAADLATGRMRAVVAVWRATTMVMRSGGREAYRLARSGTAAAARHDPAVEPYRAIALGRSLTTLDRPYDALKAFDHLSEVVERQQISRFAGRAENYRSWVLRNLGATSEADDATAVAWDLVGSSSELAHAEARCHACLDQADAALRAGDVDAADAWLHLMSDAPTSPHVMRWRLDLRRLLLRGRWALASDDADLASSLGEQVRAEALRLGVERFVLQAEHLTARAALRRGERVDLTALEAMALRLPEAAPLESWWLLGELAQDTDEARLRALAEERVDALARGAGPWAEQLRRAGSRLL